MDYTIDERCDTMHDHLGDRLANAISHGTGVLLSVVGLIYLLTLARTTIEVFAFLVYGISLITLYTCSTVHHAVKMPTDKGFYILKGLDYMAIYLLIVGTYTPFVLLSDQYPSGVLSLIVLWLVAFGGIVFKLFQPRKWNAVHIVLYLLMGWSIIFIWADLGIHTSELIITYIIIGGIFYTGGLSFFVLSYVKKNWHYTHLLWHLSVLGGSVMHFVAVVHIV